jgi:hypothetical protein
LKTEGNFLLRYKRQVFILLSIIFLCLSCQPRKSTSIELPEEPAATEAPILYPPPREVVKTVEVAKGELTPVPSQFTNAYPGPYFGAQIIVTRSATDDSKGRMIVKNADMRLLVEDTPIAIDRLTQIVEDVNGYIISSRVWYQEQLESKYQFATLTIGVPVDDFELTLRRIRDISILVLDESTTGKDVTDEFVDLNSQLENLQATRDRIRTFLNRAENAEEALKVNEQLTQVEVQIAQIQGRMNYLFDRAAYSTITVTLEPELPIPQTEPTPTPTAWSPNNTASEATDALVNISRDLIDIGIWFLIFVLPLVIVPLLLIFIIIYIVRRRRTKPLHEEDTTAKNE